MHVGLILGSDLPSMDEACEGNPWVLARTPWLSKKKKQASLELSINFPSIDATASIRK